MRTYYPEEYYRRSGYKVPIKNEIKEKKLKLEDN